MAQIRQETYFDLPRHDIVGLLRVDGQTIQCNSGELWITQAGDRRDILLKPGMRWTVEGDGEIVISALQPAGFVLVSARDCRLPGLARGVAASWMRDLLLRWKAPPLACLPASMLR